MTTRGRCGLALVFALTFLATGCNLVEKKATFKVSDPAAHQGGTLRVGITKPGSIESANAYEPMGQLVVSLLCDPLLQADPATGALHPAMAETLAITGRGTTFAIKSREDVAYHNGAKMSAFDIEYAMSRVARQDYASYVADLLQPIVGYDATHRNLQTADKSAERDARVLAGVHAYSRHALEILVGPANADVERILAHPLASPTPRRLPDEAPDAFAHRPVCNGPYEMAEAWPAGGTAIRLKRFGGYWRGSTAFTNKGAGYVDTIEFVVYDSLDAAFDAYARGEVDIAPVAPAKLAAARQQAAADLVTAPTGQVEYVGLPTTKPPFDNPAVRRAFSLALDRQAIVDTVFAGGRRPASGFLPPTITSATYRDGACAAAPARADLAAATAALSASGTQLDPSQPITLYVNDDHRNKAMMVAVAQQWETAFHVPFRVETIEWDAYTTKATGTSGLDGPFRLLWDGGYASADRYLYPLLHSSGIGQNNFARYRDPVLDRRLDRVARRTDDDGDRDLAYREIEDALCDDMPMIPLTFGQGEYLIRTAKLASAAGIWTDRSTGQPLLREYWLK